MWNFSRRQLTFLSGYLCLYVVLAYGYAQNVLNENQIIQYYDAGGSALSTREGSTYYRKLQKIMNGCFLVQDFYSVNDTKQIDPICLTNIEDITNWDPKSLQGVLTFWSKSGKKMQEEAFDKGLANGALTIWFENGTKQIEGTKIQGKKEGDWVIWDETGNEIDRIAFINDQQVIAYFTKTGELTKDHEKSEYYRTLIERQGHYLTIQDFYKNGAKQTSPFKIVGDEELYAWEIKKIDGSVVFWSKEGEKLSEETYKNGLLDGAMTLWHSNGFKLLEGQFVKGKKEGIWRSWHDNRNLRSEVTFSDDAFEGKRMRWYPSGQKEAEGQYLNHKRDGQWLYWYKNGQLSSLSNYKEDMKDGEQLFWNESGKEVNKELYLQGKKLTTPEAEVAQQSPEKYKESDGAKAEGEWQYWYDNGQLEARGAFAKDLWTGPWTYWYIEGGKESEGSYIDGKREGLWIFWHRNGNKKSEGHFLNDKENGEWLYWHENGTKKSVGHYK